VIEKVKNWIFHHFTGFLNKCKRIPKVQSKNGQFSKTGNIGYTRRRKTNQKHKTGNIGYTRRRKTKQKHKTGNIGYTRRRKTKQKHNTICVGHHNTQTKTNYVNKTCVLQTTGGKDEPNIVFFAEIVTDIPTLNSQVSLQTALYCWMCIMLYESSF
jgi:hypothetical protein